MDDMDYLITGVDLRPRDTALPVGRVAWGPAYRQPSFTPPCPKGWECPKCARVWGPSVTECKPCNAGKAKRSIVRK